MFNKLFHTKQFEINQITSRLIANCGKNELYNKISNKRELSRMIAKCSYYNYKSTKSLAEIFNVSVEAMAIRLEELNLVKY